MDSATLAVLFVATLFIPLVGIIAGAVAMGGGGGKRRSQGGALLAWGGLMILVYLGALRR